MIHVANKKDSGLNIVVVFFLISIFQLCWSFMANDIFSFV